MLEHRHPVDNSVLLDRCGPHIRRLSDRHERHEPAVRASRDADLLRVGVTGCLKKLSGVNLVLQVASTEILIVSLLKLDAVSGGSAHVGRDADIAAGNQSGHPCTPVVLSLSSRTTVR